MGWRLWVGVLLVGGIGVLGCAAGDADGLGEIAEEQTRDDERGRDRRTTTAGDSATTTTLATTTTTAAVGPELAGGPGWSATGPSGAGCTPGDVEQLPDGWWAGEIRGVDGGTLDFDLVCFFGGEAGMQAAADDGVEFTNDYHVRNNNPRTFAETFADTGGPATCVGLDARPFPCTVADVLGLYPGTGQVAKIDGREVAAFPYVWLHVTGRAPDYLYVQFTP